MPLAGPTMIRRQLGRRLRALRHQARKTEADVEEANLASRTKLWKIETGKVAVKIGDVRGLCWLYGIDQQTTDNLSLLAAASNQRGYWEDFDEPHTPSWLYLQMESIADEIRNWQPGVVHELLQTPAYFRELRRAVAPEEKDHALRERVKLHVERQETIFTRPQPPRLTVILSAGVLVCPVGDGDDVMVGQLDHLHEIPGSAVDVAV